MKDCTLMQHFDPKIIDKHSCSDRIETDDSITVMCIETAGADNRKQDSPTRRDAGTKRLIIDDRSSQDDFGFQIAVLW